MSSLVIDISAWQHPSGAAIDWAAVAASGVSGVIIKATQGSTYVNPYFAGDYTDARQAGLMVGAYHFAEPGTATPDSDAAWFVDHTVGLDLTLGQWLDLEVMTAGGAFDTQQWATTWLAAVAVGTRVTGVYLNASFAEAMPALATGYPLWFAGAVPPGAPLSPVILQSTTPGPVPGISGDVDHDTLLNPRRFNPPGPTPAPDPAPASLEDEMGFVYASDAADGIAEGSQWLVSLQGRREVFAPYNDVWAGLLGKTPTAVTAQFLATLPVVA